MLVAPLLLLLSASVVFATSLVTRQYTVYNNCPTPIDLYVNDTSAATIPTNGNITEILPTDPFHFFTTANGGSQNADGTIYAGFHDDYYYIVSDPNHANTGLRVKPVNRSQPYSNSFCQEIQCDRRGCPQAFLQPPTSFNASASTVPSPPYYRCPIASTDYEIRFCPTGQFPDQGQPIHFNHLQNKCLGLRSEFIGAETPLQVYDCIGTQAQSWVINKGSTRVQVAGTNFCLDAGTNPADGVQLKIEQCDDNLPGQKWNFTANNHIVLENQGFCMDLENGVTTTGSKAQVQTWTCSNENTNQVWTL